MIPFSSTVFPVPDSARTSARAADDCCGSTTAARPGRPSPAPAAGPRTGPARSRSSATARNPNAHPPPTGCGAAIAPAVDDDLPGLRVDPHAHPPRRRPRGRPAACGLDPLLQHARPRSAARRPAARTGAAAPETPPAPAARRPRSSTTSHGHPADQTAGDPAVSRDAEPAPRQSPAQPRRCRATSTSPSSAATIATPSSAATGSHRRR